MDAMPATAVDALPAPALERLQAYLEALQEAGLALDRARRLFPDHGLDHGVERIRAMMLSASAELQRRLAEGACATG
ncbi:MAG: hypothetical protein KatS3mg126_0347 [Lysobacteraceae bacterium]|nr:MAG: hypothetical protein KatS3mg126_0347 [Xanthomonadaceae bacterium]